MPHEYKLFVKFEKKLACDLKPGELFIIPEGKPALDIDGEEIAVPVFLRTNTSADEVADPFTVVYKVHTTVTNAKGIPVEARVDPHKPPGS